MTSEWCCGIAAASTTSSGVTSTELPAARSAGKWRGSPFPFAGLARRTGCGLPGFRDGEGGRRQADRAGFNGNFWIAAQEDRARPADALSDRDVHGAVAQVGRDPQRSPVHEEP